MIGTLISGVTALLFPMFASYRALVSNDISLIRPWLMYWVVFGSFEFAESMFRPLLNLVPFYGLFRLGFLFWLVLPQTQGAVQLYQGRLEPWLSGHDQMVESTITRGLEFAHSSRWAGFLSILGIHLPKPPPSDSVSGQTSSGSGAGGWGSSWGSNSTNQKPNSNTTLTDMFMSRFRLSGSPDTNISAYLPSLLGGNESSEYTAVVRNSLLSMVRSIDSRQVDNSASENGPKDRSASSSRSNPASGFTKDADEYDFVERPQNTSPPHETVIEREVEAELRHEPHKEARRRWI